MTRERAWLSAADVSPAVWVEPRLRAPRGTSFAPSLFVRQAQPNDQLLGRVTSRTCHTADDLAALPRNINRRPARPRTGPRQHHCLTSHCRPRWRLPVATPARVGPVTAS